MIIYFVLLEPTKYSWDFVQHESLYNLATPRTVIRGTYLQWTFRGQSYDCVIPVLRHWRLMSKTKAEYLVRSKKMICFVYLRSQKPLKEKNIKI